MKEHWIGSPHLPVLSTFLAMPCSTQDSVPRLGIKPMHPCRGSVESYWNSPSVLSKHLFTPIFPAGNRGLQKLKVCPRSQRSLEIKITREDVGWGKKL